MTGTQESAPLRHVQLYTDGACSGNPGPGGWAFVLRDLKKKKEKEQKLEKSKQEPEAEEGEEEDEEEG